MSAPRRRGRRIASAFALLLFPLASSAAAPLGDMETRGRQLYFFGTDASSPAPMALLGIDSTRTPARLVPCASCHGDDGAGRPEGVINPPSIVWRHLTHASAVTVSGRARPPYSDEAFERAVTKGEDSSGRRLDDIMPRYEFSADQLRALIAYLKVIEADQAPGVSGDAIRIAIMLPQPNASSASDLMRRVLSAYADDLNIRGGIFNRRLELVMLDTSDAVELLGALLRDREIFAVLAMDTDAHARALAIERLVEETPTIRVADILDGSDRARTRTKFSLFADDATQTRVMVDYVAQLFPGKPVQFAMLFPDGAQPAGAWNAVVQQNMKLHGPPPIERGYDRSQFDARAAVFALAGRGVDAVAFVGDAPQLATLIEALKSADWRPYLLIPGGAISAALFEAPKDIAAKIILAFPMVADDASKNATFVSLQRNNALPRRHVASQVAAYCAAEILAQGLKLAGREVTRHKFLTALESLRGYDTGLIPPVTFGPNQHVGSYGAYIFGVETDDKRFKMVGDWKSPW